MPPVSIPFAELTPGAVVRVTDDNPALIYAVDLVMAVTRKDRNRANEVFRKLDNNLFSKEKIVVMSFPGHGNTRTRLVTFDDALTLVMVMPGKVAKEIRKKACSILRRYFAGDATLVREIEANSASQEPLSVLARQANAADSAVLTTAVPMDVDTYLPLIKAVQTVVRQEVAPFVDMAEAQMTRLQAEIARKDTDLEHERHLRHQADGRLGSEVRKDNQLLREVATEAKKDKQTAIQDMRDAAREAKQDKDFFMKQLEAKDAQIAAKDALIALLTGGKRV